ncbi:MAG TPA: magnesium transporter [Vicinamibacterales bacterium]|nr:magnesium transporter [Vicinamibacterales bacterium]
MPTRKPSVNLQETFDEIAAMLDHHRALLTLARGQDASQRGVGALLQERQNSVELRRRLRGVHPADLAAVLTGLPPDSRLQIWTSLDARQAAEVMVELDASARAWLVDQTDRHRLTKIASNFDPDDLAWVSEELPDEVMRDVKRSLDEIDRNLLQQADAYPYNSVGRLMSVDIVAVRESQTIADILADLQARVDLPGHLDRLFVVDARNLLRGALSLQSLVLAKPDTPVAAIMEADPLAFRPTDMAARAAQAFERYDLVSVPVINDRGKLVGRLTVDAVVDFIRVTADKDALSMAGLQGAEDLFASVWQSARNRSFWLFVNLITAFVATRFIGLFESTIQELVALATLMPVVASIGGNTGNQTVALVIRGLAFEQLTGESRAHLLRKEIIVSLLNGIIWGGMVGVLAGLFYHQIRLGMVMTGAIMLNLVIAAAVGVLVPLTLHRIGRDPAQGSSVLLTFMTDSMGFFLFLGLARLFL